MTDESIVLSSAPLPPSENYIALREEAIRLVQAMSGQIWTDYNFSDPGVTIVEQVCYALTELGYRAKLPVEDLLCEPRTGAIRLRQAGLYPARAILPVNPVTLNDLRRLLIDRVPGVANCWFTPVDPSQANGVNGLYSIALLVPEQDPCCRGPHHRPEEVREEARRVYCAHRALCEDVEQIFTLKFEHTAITASVQIDDSCESAAILADLIFHIGLLLAPEPKRQSLDALIAEGKSSTEIFNGTLMYHGFIADDQLTPLPRAMPVNDILRVMAETPGVVAVRDLSVRVAGESYVPGETIPIEPGRVLWIETGFEEGSHGIKLYRNAVLCTPDRDRVRRILETLWAAQRATWPLEIDYREQYPVPQGESRDLTAYSSVQNQFPNVYGINEYGLPEYATAARKAQAKQLKGYLMVFDQLMADYFAQLGFIRELFSIRAGRWRTYAVQSLRPIVPDVEPLLSPGYMKELTAIVAASDPVIERQSAILDLFLSLYAERLSLPSEANCDCNADTGANEELLRAKQILLARTVPVTRDRGRGFDYLCQPGQANATGLEIICRIELGLLDVALLSSDEKNAAVVAESEDADFGRRLSPEEAGVVEAHFLPAGDIGENADDAAGPEDSPIAGRRVADVLQPSLELVENYRIGVMPGETGVDLVCRDENDGWWLLGRYDGTAGAVAAMTQLVRGAGRMLRRHQIYFIEHILLRYAQPRDDGDGAYYSFRMTAVVHMTYREADSETWRAQVRETARRNSPAHVAIDVVFVHRHAFHEFLRRYRQWRDALRHGGWGERRRTSRALERFLRTHHGQGGRHDPEDEED
jgi:hypothetical protein